MQAVRLWLKHPMWDQDRVRGPWDVDKALAWAAFHLDVPTRGRDGGGGASGIPGVETPRSLKDRAADLSPDKFAAMQLNLARKRQVDLKNKVLEGELLGRRDVENEVAQFLAIHAKLLMAEVRALVDAMHTKGWLVEGQRDDAYVEAEKRMATVLDMLERNLRGVTDYDDDDGHGS